MYVRGNVYTGGERVGAKKEMKMQQVIATQMGKAEQQSIGASEVQL